MAGTPWVLLLEREEPMLMAALNSLKALGILPDRARLEGSLAEKVKHWTRLLLQDKVRGFIIVCRHPLFATCLANKQPGIRAAAVCTIRQAKEALSLLGANVLILEPDRTFFEYKEVIRLFCSRASIHCPPSLAETESCVSPG